MIWSWRRDEYNCENEWQGGNRLDQKVRFGRSHENEGVARKTFEVKNKLMVETLYATTSTFNRVTG